MLNIEIHNQTGVGLPLSDESISNIIIQALDNLQIKEDHLVEVEFVDKTTIKNLNARFRNINQATDILSFPQIRLESGRIKPLGTLVICPEVVIAKSEGFDDVIKHGLLHLLGYDHETNGQAWAEAAKKVGCEL